MIYLDSAATTFQKPPEVAAAVETAMEEMSSPGRGGYPAAMKAAETLFACRCELADLFRAASPEQVIFTMNATQGLNVAIKSLVPPGGRAVISGYEHNAVTRPLRALEADVTAVRAPLFRPAEMADRMERCISSCTDAVICTQVSNVFGAVMPLAEISEICRAKGVPLIVDASQGAGVLPLDMTALGAAFVAMPGHKSLYGPQGTGVLLCGEGVPVKPLIEGGTGSVSDLQEMPDFLPDRLEPGTHNVPGIAGLLEGIRYVKRLGIGEICRKERILARQAAEQLEKLPGVRVFLSPEPEEQTAVVSFVSEKKDAETVGAELADAGVAVRSGLHCAPLAHESAGTLETGTVRLSISALNTAEEIRQFSRIIRQILV